METMLMINEDGESGEVKLTDVPEAFKQKYRRAVKLLGPNNKQTVVAMDDCNLYLAAGFRLDHTGEK